MLDKIRIAYMHVDDPGYESTMPPEWSGLRHLVRNKGRVRDVVDDFGSHEVRVYDLSFAGYRGIPDGSSVHSLEQQATDGALCFLRTYGRFSVLVIGATQVARLLLARILRAIEDRDDLVTPLLVIDFSRHCAGPGIVCDKPGPFAGHEMPFLCLHCPKDFGLLWKLLSDAELLGVLRDEVSWEKVRAAVDSFNARHRLSP